MNFHPNNHLIQLKSKEGTKDYLPVQWRLVWFREACPQGTIETEEMEIDLDREVTKEVAVWNNNTRSYQTVTRTARGYARFRAVVTDGKGGVATGTKTETAVDFPDFCEKAETGAVGRALAGLGYGTQFAPEISEGDDHPVDAPVERSEPGRTEESTQIALPSVMASRAVGKITSEQIKAITQMSRTLGRGITTGPNGKPLTELGSMEASSLIESLNSEMKAFRAHSAPSPDQRAG
jgi:hypothetical protein